MRRKTLNNSALDLYLHALHVCEIHVLGTKREKGDALISHLGRGEETLVKQIFIAILLLEDLVQHGLALGIDLHGERFELDLFRLLLVDPGHEHGRHGGVVQHVLGRLRLQGEASDFDALGPCLGPQAIVLRGQRCVAVDGRPANEEMQFLRKKFSEKSRKNWL